MKNKFIIIIFLSFLFKPLLAENLNIQSLNGLKIGVQGFGKVGYYLCPHLKNEGAEIYGFDVNENSLERVKNEFEFGI